MRWILALIWLAFIVYAWFWVPGQPLGIDPVFKELVTLQSKEPWLLTVFSWLGIYPAIFACLLLRRSGKARGSRGWAVAGVIPLIGPLIYLMTSRRD